MHELSIAQNIIEIVEQYVPREQMTSVRSVRLKVGTLSGIVPESLEFCFGAIVKDTSLERSSLDIERVPIQVKCKSCSISFLTEDPVFACNSCGGTGIEFISGTELQIIEIEVADRNEEI